VHVAQHLPGGAAFTHLREAARHASAEAGCDAWFVGGCVRDALLGRDSADLDIVVRGDPHRVARHALEHLRQRLPQGARLGLGCLDAAGTWRVVADGAYLDVLGLEGTLAEDLARRDLTINAMALPVSATSLADVHDPLGGRADLAARLLRTPARANLAADPVRMLRVARFAVTLGMPIEQDTRVWIRASAGLLASAPGERLGYEVMRAFAGERSAAFARVVEDLGLLPEVLPELLDLQGLYQGGYHHVDAYEHSLEALRLADEFLSDAGAEGAPDGGLPHDLAVAVRSEVTGAKLSWVRSRPALLRLGALLHDIGKPRARTVDDDGRVRFSDHPRLGAEGIAGLGERLKLSRAERRYLTVIAREHMRPCLLAFGESTTPRAYGRLLRDLDELAPDVCAVSLADRLAARGAATTAEALRTQTDTIAHIVRLWLASKTGDGAAPPLIRGKDVMAATGLPPGPGVGRLLAEVRSAQLAGELGTHEDAVEFVRRKGSENG
jgi:poly(A) polymerase